MSVHILPQRKLEKVFQMQHILIVEDDESLAMGLEDDLKLEGYQVQVVQDGEMASRKALA